MGYNLRVIRDVYDFWGPVPILLATTGETGVVVYHMPNGGVIAKLVNRNVTLAAHEFVYTDREVINVVTIE